MTLETLPPDYYKMFAQLVFVFCASTFILLLVVLVWLKFDKPVEPIQFETIPNNYYIPTEGYYYIPFDGYYVHRGEEKFYKQGEWIKIKDKESVFLTGRDDT